MTGHRPRAADARAPEVLQQGGAQRRLLAGSPRRVVLAAGLVLVLAAALARFAVYPQLARIPLAGLTLRSTAHHATIAGELSTAQERVVTLRDTVRFRPVRRPGVAGDAAGDRTPEGWAVFRRTVRDLGGYALLAGTSRDLVLVDRGSGQARPCCRPAGPGAPPRASGRGLLFAFPPGASRDDYRWWDETLRRPVPIRFAASGRLAGLPASAYVRDTPPTVVATLLVPGQVVGSARELVRADRVYSARERIWVNPASGVVLQDRRTTRTELRYHGKRSRTLLAATFRYDRATLARNAAHAGRRATALDLAGTYVPWAAGLAGLLLLGVGATMRGRRDSSGAGPPVSPAGPPAR